MKEDPSKYVRGYIHSREAWYYGATTRGKDILDDVMFGLYHPEGGCLAEMMMEWHILGGKPYARLEVYDESWTTLLSFSDVLEKLSAWQKEHDFWAGNREETLSSKEFCRLLDECGFVDRTPRKYEDSYPNG